MYKKKPLYNKDKFFSYVKEIIEGKRRPFFFCILLSFSSYCFHLVVIIRNFLYDKGWLCQKKLNKPVISIGNIVSGGTGNTPLTLMLAEELTICGCKVGVLSRGYGSILEKSKDGVLSLTKKGLKKLESWIGSQKAAKKAESKKTA